MRVKCFPFLMMHKYSFDMIAIPRIFLLSTLAKAGNSG